MSHFCRFTAVKRKWVYWRAKWVYWRADYVLAIHGQTFHFSRYSSIVKNDQPHIPVLMIYHTIILRQKNI